MSQENAVAQAVAPATSPAPLPGGDTKPASMNPCCRVALAAGAKFCPECGTALERQAVEPPSQPLSESNALQMTPPPRLTPIVQNAPAKAAVTASADALAGVATPPRQGEQESSHIWHLVIKVNDAATQSIVLPAGGLCIGKAKGCGLVLANDDYVSRQHAKLSWHEGKLILEDQNSSNGTFFRLREPVALETGDEFVIGTTVLRVEMATA